MSPLTTNFNPSTPGDFLTITQSPGVRRSMRIKNFFLFYFAPPPLAPMEYCPIYACMRFIPGFSRGEATRAQQWSAMLSMVVAMARQILRLRTAQPSKAFQKAEMLEAWCFMALTHLSHQIDAQVKTGMPARLQDQLPPLAVTLLALLLIIRRIKNGLLSTLKQRRLPRAEATTLPLWRGALHTPGFLDSG